MLLNQDWHLANNPMSVNNTLTSNNKMNTQRWLIEYDTSADPKHFLETASAHEVHIVGVYPEALGFVAEASEKALRGWVATLAVRRVRANAFPEEEIRRVLRTEARLTAKSATFWALVYGIPSDQVAALRTPRIRLDR